MKPYTIRIGNKLWVHFQGRIYALPAQLKKNGTMASEESADELVAPFSCKVLKVFVEDGQKVAQGDPVITVEAMKMEYSYASPRAGVIRRVLVSPGMIVQEGAQFVDWGQT